MSLSELRQLCVNNFPLSTTRSNIMIGLENVINKLIKTVDFPESGRWVVPHWYSKGEFVDHKEPVIEVIKDE